MRRAPLSFLLQEIRRDQQARKAALVAGSEWVTLSEGGVKTTFMVGGITRRDLGGSKRPKKGGKS